MVKVVTSEERFWESCPCANVIVRYVSELPKPPGLDVEFRKAIIRASHTTALFVCPDLAQGSQELWISATSDGQGGWTLRHAPIDNE